MRIGPRALPIAVNIGLRAAICFFGAEAILIAARDPLDRRFSGKGIAARNALLIGGFSLAFPLLQMRNRSRSEYPWAADALLLSIPAADMAGNSLDLYNRLGAFDITTHTYGTAVASALATLAMGGRATEPILIRRLVALGGTTLFHVLLEAQEYWTDVLFGTQNVHGLADMEGDLLAGLLGAFTGAALAERAVRTSPEAAREARRLAALFERKF